MNLKGYLESGGLMDLVVLLVSFVLKSLQGFENFFKCLNGKY